MITATHPEPKMPSRLNTLLEFTSPIEWMRVGLSANTLRQAPSGDGRPVLLLPGYMSSHRAMIPLASFLRSKNYDTYHWRQGLNRGDIYKYVEVVGERLQNEFDEPVTLIGWSLGGVIARELARLYEPNVREVITMGTPVIGGPKYTVAGGQFSRERDLDLDEFEDYVHSINSIGLKQPITVFYSKRDGIVSWQAAIDTYNDHARNIEIDTTHLGIGINANVWVEIAETLAGS